MTHTHVNKIIADDRLPNCAQCMEMCPKEVSKNTFTDQLLPKKKK